MYSLLFNKINRSHRTNSISLQWRRAVTILIHKKDSADDPSNFRPLTLQSIPLKVFTSALRNEFFVFSRKFMPGMSGIFERTANLVHLIRQAKRNQRSLVVTLQGLRNAFGEVHYNLIPVVLAHHHILDNIIQAIMSIYEDFTSTIAIDSFTTPFLHIKKSAIQGNCLSPLVFHLIINNFIQFVPKEQFSQLDYSLINFNMSNTLFSVCR